MRGFSNVMSNVIFFIGAVLAVSLAVSAMGMIIKQIQYSMDVRAKITAERTETILDVVDGGYNGTYLWFYVKNIGNTTLEVNKFDIFVEGNYMGSCNAGTVVCTDDSGDSLLTPDELMEVNLPYSGTGVVRVRAVSENGAYAEGKVVLG